MDLQNVKQKHELIHSYLTRLLDQTKILKPSPFWALQRFFKKKHGTYYDFGTDLLDLPLRMNSFAVEVS